MVAIPFSAKKCSLNPSTFAPNDFCTKRAGGDDPLELERRLNNHDATKKLEPNLESLGVHVGTKAKGPNRAIHVL
jgi:hypothetical protein